MTGSCLLDRQKKSHHTPANQQLHNMFLYNAALQAQLGSITCRRNSITCLNSHNQQQKPEGRGSNEKHDQCVWRWLPAAPSVVMLMRTDVTAAMFEDRHDECEWWVQGRQGPSCNKTACCPNKSGDSK